MLNTEFGGMNEVLADLYADTGDQRWLDLSHHFDHHAVLDPLARREDILAGLHGNTQAPKLLGYLERYIYTGDKTDGSAAEFFWDAVALHHSYATGGHGRDEYFGPPDKLGDRVEGRTDESCNVYNILKMTRRLFAIRPEMKYAEFEERALFNHVLGSIDPDDGRTCYMVPVGRGVQHEYQDMMRSFTCCVGSGMESHGLHGDGIYYESGDRLWVNLYVPSTVTWQSAGVGIVMDTSFPEGDAATLKLTLQKPKQFTVALRRPSWSGAGFTVIVNGTLAKDLSKPGSYVELKRTWKNGDTVALVLPKTLRVEPTPDNPNRVALMWGPLVLAGDLGPEQERRRGPDRSAEPQAPVLVAAALPVENWLKPVTGKPGMFRTSGVGLTSDVDFLPFYQLPRRRYAIYWDVFTPQEWKKKSEAYVAEEERKKKLEASNVAFAQPGQMQTERDFNQEGEDTSPIQLLGHYGRRGSKRFSVDLPVDTAHPMTLIVTYSNEARRNGTFDVLVDGTKVGQQATERRSPEQDIRFFDVEYALPPQLVEGKQKVTVRFEAADGNEISGVFGIRMIRADSAR